MLSVASTSSRKLGKKDVLRSASGEAITVVVAVVGWCLMVEGSVVVLTGEVLRGLL